MHLVNHQMVDALPVIVPARLAKQKGQTLRGGDQNVWRRFTQATSIAGRGITGAHANPDRRGGYLATGGNLQERLVQVPLNIVAQAPERRDINAAQPCAKLAQLVITQQKIKNGQKCGQGFAGPCGGRKGGVLAAGNHRPCGSLDGRRPEREARFEPVSNTGMAKGIQAH